MRPQRMVRVDAAQGGSFAARAADALEAGRRLRDLHRHRFVSPEAIAWVRAELRQLEVHVSETGCSHHARGLGRDAAAYAGRALVIEELIDHLDDRLVMLQEAAAAAEEEAPAAAPAVGPPPSSPAELLAEAARTW